MNDKKKPAQPAPAQPDPVEEAPDEERAGKMEGEVAKVVAEEMFPPEVPLDPERRPGQGPVIGLGHGKPDSPQAGQAVQLDVVPDQLLVVPKPASVESGPEDPQPRRHDDQRLKDRLPVGRPKWRRRCFSRGGRHSARLLPRFCRFRHGVFISVRQVDSILWRSLQPRQAG